MGRRFAARLIDGLILTFVLGVLLELLLTQAAAWPAESTAWLTASAVRLVLVVLVLGIVYEVAFIALRGATPGKSALGLRVIREVDGRVPGWGPSMVRWLIPTAAGLVFFGVGQFLVYISPFFDPTKRNQGWHDMAARTLVVTTWV